MDNSLTVLGQFLPSYQPTLVHLQKVPETDFGASWIPASISPYVGVGGVGGMMKTHGWGALEG